MKKNPRKITDDEKKFIITSYKNNISISRIAKTLDRYPDVIRHCLEKENVYHNTVRYMDDNELELIVADYKNGMTPKELSEKYNRSDGYLINKLKSLGIYTPTLLRLSEKEWEDIASLYSKGNISKILMLYPSLSKSVLYSKMSAMKVSFPNRWSDDDIAIVQKYYGSHKTSEICDMIDNRHSCSAINTFALKCLGISKDRSWTDAELNIIKKYYSSIPVEDVLQMLPNRTLEGLRNQAKKMGIVSYYRESTYWTNEENTFLCLNWLNLSDREIADKLGKTRGSVKDRRNLLGLFRANMDYENYPDIKSFLRANIWNWKQKSMQQCNYQCVLTGSREFHIHHLYAFNDIVKEFLDYYNPKSKYIKDYTKEELTDMGQQFSSFHSNYPLGICVRNDLHTLFHKIYGKYKINADMWNRFQLDYIQGKYPKNT